MQNNISVRYDEDEIGSSLHGNIEKGEIHYSSNNSSSMKEVNEQEQSNADGEHQNEKGKNEAPNSDSDDGDFF